jgi:hypothetical protein
VPVELAGDTSDFNVALFPWRDAPPRGPLLGHCVPPCTLQVPLGSYSVLVYPHAGSDVHTSDRRAEVTGPTRLSIDPPSRFTRSLGLVLGITGSVLVGGGIIYLAQNAPSRGSDAEREEREVAGGIVIVTGIVAAGAGWTLFGLNRSPSVDAQPIR